MNKNNHNYQEYRIQYFTIIELLAVIAIFSILLTLLLHSMKKAREATKNAVCLANFGQIGIATYSYAAANNGNLPASFNGDGMTPPYWYGALKEYISHDNEWSASLYSCPTVSYSGETQNPLNYGSNTELFRHHPSPATPWENQGFRLNIAQVLWPDQTYTVADLAVWNPDNGSAYPFNRFPFSWTIEWWRYTTDPSQSLPAYQEFDNTYSDDSIKIRFRHNGDKTANFAFPDGHATSKRMSSMNAYNMFNRFD